MISGLLVETIEHDSDAVSKLIPLAKPRMAVSDILCFIATHRPSHRVRLSKEELLCLPHPLTLKESKEALWDKQALGEVVVLFSQQFWFGASLKGLMFVQACVLAFRVIQNSNLKGLALRNIHTAQQLGLALSNHSTHAKF